MQINKIEEKMAAIRKAEDCMHSVLSVNANAVDLGVFVTLNELKMDLIDHQDEQEHMIETFGAI